MEPDSASTTRRCALLANRGCTKIAQSVTATPSDPEGVNKYACKRPDLVVMFDDESRWNVFCLFDRHLIAF